jgi:hypothetical protein
MNGHMDGNVIFGSVLDHLRIVTFLMIFLCIEPFVITFYF